FEQNVCGPVQLVSAGVITSGGQAQFNGGNVILSPSSGVLTFTQLLTQGGAQTGSSGGSVVVGPASNNVRAGTPLRITTNCDPDWGFFQGGIRTQWSPAPGFNMGIDLGYSRVFTAFRGSQANLQNVAFGASSGNANIIEPVIGVRP